VSPNRERHYRALFRFCRILGEEAVRQQAVSMRKFFIGFHRLYFSTVAWRGNALLPWWRGSRPWKRSRPRHSSFPTRSLLPGPPIRHCGWAVVLALGPKGPGRRAAAKACFFRIPFLSIFSISIAIAISIYSGIGIGIDFSFLNTVQSESLKERHACCQPRQ
jgi:hypothetical protein